MVAKDIMTTDFPYVRPDTVLADAQDVLFKSGTLLVPVIGEDGCPCGVLLEADLLRAVLPKFLDSLASLNFLPESCSLYDVDIKVEQMTVDEIIEERTLHTIEEDTRLVQIAHIFVTKKIAAVGVVRDDSVIGMVHRRDLVEHIFEHTLCEVEYDDE
ncbi:MAG: HPP family protein [Armatimonadota bacterium]